MDGTHFFTVYVGSESEELQKIWRVSLSKEFVHSAVVPDSTFTVHVYSVY